MSGQSSLEEGVSAPGPRYLGTHHPEEYIQVFIHSFIYPSFHPSFHSFILLFILPFIHPFFNTYIHAFLLPSIIHVSSFYAFIDSFFHHSFIDSSFNSFIHPFIHLCINVFIRSPIPLLIHSFMISWWFFRNYSFTNIQIPVDSGFQQKHPQICVTDVMGDQFKYIFSEQIESMDQSS